jgi:DNA polymerase
MTAEPSRAEILRRIRHALLDLAADGIDYLGPLARAQADRSPEATAGRADPAPTDEPTASAPSRTSRPAKGTAAASTTSPVPHPPPRSLTAGGGTPSNGWQPLVPPLGPLPPLDANGQARALELERIRADLGECTRCKLCEGRTHVVFGEGNPASRVVFVGEGPGSDEDRSGRPFVGRAGELLSRMIQSVGWRREDVYICNVVKCRPPNNRDPELDEIAACRPFLERQIRAIEPVAIVTLGKPALSTLLGRPVAITRERGHWTQWNGFPVMPTFHPAYLLRNYTRETRQAVWDDLRAARARVDEAP